MDSRARVILDLHDQLKSERSQLDGLYQEIAKRVWPDYAVFHRSHTNSSEGGNRSFELFDATGAVALDRFASALMKMTAPSNRRWHKLTIDSERLKQSAAAKAWLEHLTDVLFRRRYAKQSNFATQYLECCKTIGAFGPMATIIDEMFDRESGRFVNRYKALHLSTTFFTEDAWGRIDGATRLVPMTATQMAQRFGEKALPEKIRAAITSPSQALRLQKWEVIHAIQPSQQVSDPVRGFAYSSHYVCREGGCVLQEGGYRTLPIAASRFSTMPGEKYGRSPAMLVLPSLKMLNEMKKTWLRAAHKAADPPLLAHDDGVMSTLQNRPGGVTFSGLDDQGRELVKPMYQAQRLDWAREALDDERKPINDVFLVTLFQILAEEPRSQTATEVVERAAEKATLLSPATERIQSEYHGVCIDREIELAVEAGDVEPMPDDVAEQWTTLKVEYLGELAQAQKADEVAGIMRAAEVAPAFAAVDPASVRGVKWAKAFQRVTEGFGMPQEFLATEDEMQAVEDQAQQEQMAAMLAQGAPAAAMAAKNFAQAEQIRSTSSAASAAPAGPALAF